MLVILTGDIQIGKTRFLEAVVLRLEQAGVVCEGVLAPGIWEEHSGDLGAAGTVGTDTACVRYEKLGINNLLLPDHVLVPFALREDLARSQGLYKADAQAAQAHLGWHIDDRAIGLVNAHFDRLAAHIRTHIGSVHPNPQGANPHGAAPQNGCSEPDVNLSVQRRLLFVDELGRLELLHGTGLVSAMALLDAGPQAYYEHAVVVARAAGDLAQLVQKRFAHAWGGSVCISPDETAWKTWFAPVCEPE